MKVYCDRDLSRRPLSHKQQRRRDIIGGTLLLTLWVFAVWLFLGLTGA